MPGDFEFRAQQDLLSRLSREVEALKRQAASGVMFTMGLPLLGASGGSVIFNGPGGGLFADTYRHNEYVSISATGTIVSTTASGAFFIRLPWTTVSAAGEYSLCGSWRGYDISSGTESSGNLFTYNDTNQLNLYGFAAGTQVTASSPWVWAPGDPLYLDFHMRLKPGS